MIKYTLERRSKLGDWIKYCDFTDLDSLDILINEMLSQNYLLKCDSFRIIKTITIQSIVYMGDIIEPIKEVSKYVG